MIIDSRLRAEPVDPVVPAGLLVVAACAVVGIASRIRHAT
jgi:hypothetical protein